MTQAGILLQPVEGGTVNFRTSRLFSIKIETLNGYKV
jgi:hypothetical protein